MSDPDDFALSCINGDGAQRPTEGDRGLNPDRPYDRPRQDYSFFGYEDDHSRSPTCSKLAKISRKAISCYLVPRVREGPDASRAWVELGS